MIKGLPNFCGNEENTLFIIGNGFDLAHGIMSKYKHFYCWLVLNGYEDYADCLQEMFPKLDKRTDFLWSNFESALEDIDLQFLFKKYVPYPNDVWDGNEWNKNISLGSNHVKDVIDRIPLLLKEWASNINIDVNPIFPTLSPESKYLTFNYTLTLENVYNIPEENICHIHEKITSKSDLIIGFDSPKFINNHPAEIDDEERAYAQFTKLQNTLVKPKLQQIEKYRSFFSSLSNINTIIVIGHSLSWVDLRYFSEIKRSIIGNAKWYFSTYQQEDYARVLSFVKPARLQPNYIKKFDFCDLS